MEELVSGEFPEFKAGDVVSGAKLTWFFDSLLCQVNKDLAQINFGTLEIIPFNAKDHARVCPRDLKLSKEDFQLEYPTMTLKVKEGKEIGQPVFAFMGVPWHSENPFVCSVQHKEVNHVEKWFAETLSDYGVYLWNAELKVSLEETPHGGTNFDALYLDAFPKDWNDLISLALEGKNYVYLYIYIEIHYTLLDMYFLAFCHGKFSFWECVLSCSIHFHPLPLMCDIFTYMYHHSSNTYVHKHILHNPIHG